MNGHIFSFISHGKVITKHITRNIKIEEIANIVKDDMICNARKLFGKVSCLRLFRIQISCPRIIFKLKTSIDRTKLKESDFIKMFPQYIVSFSLLKLI